MQVLFLWISSTWPQTLSNIGLNFSPAYDFSVEEIGEGRFCLRQNADWQGQARSLFSEMYTGIENVSALVGPNGSGKSTLLSTLMDIDAWSLSASKDRDIQDMKMRQYVLVILEDDGQLGVYSSLSQLRCEKTLPEPHCRPERDHLPFRRHSIVYLTNSAYVPYLNLKQEREDEQDVLRAAAFTPAHIDAVAKEFYGKILGLSEQPPFKIHKDAFLLASNMLRRQRKSTDFQQLLDVMYWHWLDTQMHLADYEAKVGTVLGVWTEPVVSVVREYLQEGQAIGLNPATCRLLMTVDEAQLFAEEFLVQVPLPIRCLYLNFVCEVIWRLQTGDRIRVEMVERLRQAVLRLSGNSKYLDERGMVTTNRDNHTPGESDGVRLFWPEAESTDTVEALEMWWRKRMERVPVVEKTARDYFNRAWQEIKEFSLVLKSGQWPLGKVEVSRDMAGWFIVSDSNSSVIFNREEGDSKNKNGAPAYSGFLAFVAQHIASESSFVLRHLHIRNLRMSSGERAFQNFFSWLYAVPALQERRLRDNLLLLIDEIDLYQHPQWQKNFLKRMLDMLAVCYRGKKVQVIFTTHSPLCLSDMPRENCVYIGYHRQENRRWIKLRDTSPSAQTFGRDIYALLQDGFFLQGSPMGAIADSYIGSLLQDMQVERQKIFTAETVDEWNEKDLAELGGRIDDFQRRAKKIGNVPLRKKIQSMLTDMRRWWQYVFLAAKKDRKE